MKGCSGQGMRVLIIMIGAIMSLGAIFGGCGSSDKNHFTTLNGYTFSSESATLTNRYFPGSAGDVINFIGYDSFAGSYYTWILTEGEIIQGIATVQEKGILTDSNGEDSVAFDSMLAQDIQGNVHVLKNISGDTGRLSGVAAGLAATILVPGDPKVGDSFGPSADYTGTVLSLDEIVDSYTGVLHTRFIVDQAQEHAATTGKRNQYDDYWAPGIGQVKSVWSLADGTTGYWMRLYPDFQTMQTDLLACTQQGVAGEKARLAFSEKYDVPLSKLEPFGALGYDIHEWGMIACHFELEWLPGAITWRIFSEIDGWRMGRECGIVDDYCREQARYCNHWQWHKGELESKMGHSCFRH